MKVCSALIAASLAVLALFAGLMLWPGGDSAAETLTCSSGTLSVAAAATFESEVSFDGTATSTGDSHWVRFCGEDSMYIQVVVNWNNNKDLRLTVVSPDGTTYVSDNHSGTSYEWFLLGSPLAHGDWQFIVSNNGRGNVQYHGAVAFR